MSCFRFSKFLMTESHVLNSFFRMKNLVIFRKKPPNLLGKKIIFSRYSTGTFRSSVVSSNKGANERKKEVENYIEDNVYGKDDDNEHNEGDDDDDDDDDDDYEGDSYDGLSGYDEDELKEDQGIKKNEEIFLEIADGDPDILKKLKVLELEIAVLREQGDKVPNRVTKVQWEELLNTSLSQRKQLLAFMNLNEKNQLKALRKRKIKMETTLKEKAAAGFHYYGLSGHTLFLRVYDKSINRLLAHRHLMSKLKILFDCSYQEFMNARATKGVAKQIKMCVTEVRAHRYPCHLEFCNVNKNDYLAEIMPKYVKSFYDSSFCFDVSEQSFLDRYPKEKLLYLSPHAQDDLIEFSKDDIYIIGAYVDKGMTVKASLAKAKRDKLRVARLPLDQYLSWRKGNKCLPLNTVVKMLLDMSFYNDWNLVFKNILIRQKNNAYIKRRFNMSEEVEEFQ